MAENKQQQQLKEITERLEQGVKELFSSEKYMEYLRVMSQFHNYSFSNTLLTFFTESIEFMDRNPNVALLTTDVEDKVFGRREIASARSMRVEDFKCVMTFHGGTTFARRSCFSSPMFMNIMYGNEEIAVSSYVYDKGFCIVYIPHLYIEHKPMVNKWNESNIEFLNIQGISNIYMIKKMICPVICRPLLYAAYIMRLKKNSIADRNLINEFRKKRKAFCRNNCMKKIRFNTVVKMFKEFGIKVF